MDGHTEKQMLPMLNYQGKTIVFMADLLPTYWPHSFTHM